MKSATFWMLVSVLGFMALGGLAMFQATGELQKKLFHFATPILAQFTCPTPQKCDKHYHPFANFQSKKTSTSKGTETSVP